MATLVNDSENEESIILNLVIDEVRKRTTFTAGKTVRPHVISTIPFDHGLHRFLYSLMKVFTKSRGNSCIARLLMQ